MSSQKFPRANTGNSGILPGAKKTSNLSSRNHLSPSPSSQLSRSNTMPDARPRGSSAITRTVVKDPKNTNDTGSLVSSTSKHRSQTTPRRANAKPPTGSSGSGAVAERNVKKNSRAPSHTAHRGSPLALGSSTHTRATSSEPSLNASAWGKEPHIITIEVGRISRVSSNSSVGSYLSSHHSDDDL
ncbi:hypothetical protein H0H87_002332 [Tephrocybe sp. NHM501043]|nr:hypothetical protein H0H87_002332 [Tephrocybe sp. NHM501043]